MIWALLPVGPNGDLLWDLNWTLAYSAAILTVVVVGVRLARKLGLQALVGVIVGLGSITTLNIGDHTGILAALLLLLSAAFPLVICPAWLLLARSWQAKKRGVLIAWGGMLVSMVLTLPLVDAVLDPPYMRLHVTHIIGSIITYLPLFGGLWLALTLYEKSLLKSGDVSPGTY